MEVTGVYRVCYNINHHGNKAHFLLVYAGYIVSTVNNLHIYMYTTFRAEREEEKQRVLMGEDRKWGGRGRKKGKRDSNHMLSD